MKKGFIISLMAILSIVICISFSVLATNAEEKSSAVGYAAPGGSVSTAEEFVTALGGEENVKLSEDGGTLYLKRNIALQSSILIGEGSYRIIGRGCTIYRDFISGSMFHLYASSLTDEDGNAIQLPSLTLGDNKSIDDQDLEDPDLILDGNRDRLTETAVGPIIGLLGNVYLTINPSTKLTNNHSSAEGGAIYMESFTINDIALPLEPHLVINGGEISGNTSDTDGGAIAFLGDEYGNSAGSITINSCEITGNTVTNFEGIGRGGAFYIESTSLTLNNTNISSNSADFGGAIYTADSTMLNGCTFELNRANKSGGAIYGGEYFEEIHGVLSHSANIKLTQCYIKNNSSGGAGGAITNLGKVTIPSSDSSYISDNTAVGNGAAIYNYGELVLNGGQFYSNKTSDGMGGIYNSGSLSFNGAELRLNTAVVGGAIYNTGTLYFYDGCTARNKCTAQNAPQIANFGKFYMKGSFVIDEDIIGLFPITDANGKKEYTYIDMQDKITTNVKIHIAFYRALPEEGKVTSCRTANANGRTVFSGLNIHTQTAVTRVVIFNDGSGSYTLLSDGSIKKDFPTVTVIIVSASVLAVAAVAFAVLLILKKKKSTTAEIGAPVPAEETETPNKEDEDQE